PREILYVAHGEEQPGLAVGNNLAGGGDIAGKQDATARLGLQVGERPRLGRRRHGDDVGKVDVVRNAVILHPADEPESVADAALATRLLHLAAHLPVADDEVEEPRVAHEGRRGRCDEVERAFDRYEVRYVRDDDIVAANVQLPEKPARFGARAETVRVDGVL